ncbi:MAG: hypothetical protein JKY18_10435, partial [Flavobacteriales bacterium]|nr:hypothetical protein [Flavobacteriales bacterium]
MRTELEQIEITEEYLSGKMSPTDADNFEKEMETDPKLRENVQLQRDLVKGIDRVAIKQSAQKAYRKYKGGKGGMSWMLGTIAVVLIAAAAMWFVNRDDNVGLPPLNEKGEALWADADRYLTPQLFTINNKNDTVIETEGGIVFVVPANCFLDKDGDPVAGAVELEVKEALNASDIMQSGLTSMSGDDLLESGGMFYINGRRDGETLKIDPDKGIYFEVPTDDKKAGMKLYSGARKADGTIDWQDARDLDNFLIPVDILTLDFYPPDYIEALIEMDEAAGDREFTDSLYYSFAFGNIEQLSDVVYMDTTSMSESFLNAWEPTWYYSDTIVAEMPAGINPAKIKAIWAAEFQNTNLATREFEERLPTIHRSCNAAVLELYIDNLGKNLSEIDAMAAAITTGDVKEALLGFAGRNDGKVEDGNRYAYMLKAYYVKKQKAVMAAVKKTTLAYQKEQADLQKKAQQRQME